MMDDSPLKIRALESMPQEDMDLTVENILQISETSEDDDISEMSESEEDD